MKFEGGEIMVGKSDEDWDMAAMKSVSWHCQTCRLKEATSPVDEWSR
jgi:hypothetical protein